MSSVSNVPETVLLLISFFALLVCLVVSLILLSPKWFASPDKDSAPTRDTDAKLEDKDTDPKGIDANDDSADSGESGENEEDEEDTDASKDFDSIFQASDPFWQVFDSDEVLCYHDMVLAQKVAPHCISSVYSKTVKESFGGITPKRVVWRLKIQHAGEDTLGGMGVQDSIGIVIPQAAPKGAVGSRLNLKLGKARLDTSESFTNQGPHYQCYGISLRNGDNWVSDGLDGDLPCDGDLGLTADDEYDLYSLMAVDDTITVELDIERGVLSIFRNDDINGVVFRVPKELRKRAVMEDCRLAMDLGGHQGCYFFVGSECVPAEPAPEPASEAPQVAAQVVAQAVAAVPVSPPLPLSPSSKEKAFEGNRPSISQRSQGSQTSAVGSKVTLLDIMMQTSEPSHAQWKASARAGASGYRDDSDDSDEDHRDGDEDSSVGYQEYGDGDNVQGLPDPRETASDREEDDHDGDEDGDEEEEDEDDEDPMDIIDSDDDDDDDDLDVESEEGGDDDEQVRFSYLTQVD